MGTVIFSWLTLADVKSREIGGEFFKLVEQRLGGATLGRFGPTEPLAFTDSQMGSVKKLVSPLRFTNYRKGRGYRADTRNPSLESRTSPSSMSSPGHKSDEGEPDGGHQVLPREVSQSPRFEQK